MGLKKSTKVVEKAVEAKTETAEKAVEAKTETVEKAVEAKTETVEKAVEAKTETVEKAVEAKTETVEKAVEAKTETVEKAVEAETAVTVINNNTTIVTEEAPKAVATSMQQYVAEAESAGFEGMEVGGFGSFPLITLSNGEFSADKEVWEDVQSFVGQLQNAKVLWLCSKKDEEQGDCGFSYDKINLTQEIEGCKTVEELRQYWEEDAEEMEIKEYREVLICIDDESHPNNEEYFTAKIPPASINAFKAQVFIAKNKGKCELEEVRIRFGIGKTREGKGGKSYKPWTFKPVLTT